MITHIFNLDPAVDNYAVMGNPISHSLSPLIHATFAQQTSQALIYQALLIAESEFAAALQYFQQQGGKGLNITLPFKIEAWQQVDECSARAQLAGAVNSIQFLPNAKLYGDNTDGVGFITDLIDNHQVALTGKRVLVLGAGGAVRGILQPILAEDPGQLVIVNRTIETAQTLRTVFKDLGDIEVADYGTLKSQPYDVIINGTSAGVTGGLPPISASLLHEETFCYDLMYGKQQNTAFVDWATQHGIHKAVDGLGMLVEQAAVAFWLWRGIKPTTKPVIEMISAKLAKSSQKLM